MVWLNWTNFAEPSPEFAPTSHQTNEMTVLQDTLPDTRNITFNKVVVTSPVKNYSSNRVTSEWSRNFEWSEMVEAALQEIFGYKHWRENQREIVNATMSGRDVFVTMPTGGGKSLCYQVQSRV